MHFIGTINIMALNNIGYESFINHNYFGLFRRGVLVCLAAKRRASGMLPSISRTHINNIGASSLIIYFSSGLLGSVAIKCIAQCLRVAKLMINN